MTSQYNHFVFITLIESPWSELSNGILVDVWVWNLTPNQLFCPPDPAIASSMSLWYVLSTTIHSAISQPRLALKQYHQLVHGLNSLLVWFQRRVWLADGAVCDNITLCPIGSEMVGLGWAIFTSSRNLLALLWQKSIAHVHHLGLVSQRVRHRCQIGCCLCRSGEAVSVMRRWCTVH